MNSMDETYVPNGMLQGDTKPMPMRGTGAGVSDTYGADTSGDAKNSMGSMRSMTGSDPAMDNMPCNPQERC